MALSGLHWEVLGLKRNGGFEVAKSISGEEDIPGWATGLGTGLDGVVVALDVCPADLVWQCQEEQNEIWLISINSQVRTPQSQTRSDKWQGFKLGRIAWELIRMHVRQESNKNKNLTSCYFSSKFEQVQTWREWMTAVTQMIKEIELLSTLALVCSDLGAWKQC